MALDTSKFPGTWLETYTSFFVNDWNYTCSICYASFVAAVHLIAGLGIGVVIGKLW